MAHASAPNQPERLISLDVFRGFTIAGMILVNNPGSWSHIYPPLEHAEWNGWTFTDLIFPYFLFIIGVAIPLAFSRRMERGDSKASLVVQVFRRAAILFALGLFLSGFPYFDFTTIRIPGVLQRIAVCYLVVSLIYLRSGVRGQAILTAALLAGYWLMMKLVPVPGYGAGVLEKEGNFAAYIDSLLLQGHMWSATKTWDPEGIVSTIPAIATTLFGVLTGEWLRSKREPVEKAGWMFVIANVFLIAGWVMDTWLPINKNLWTSSYSVFMTGMALHGLGLCYWLVDIKGHTRWTVPFVAYGRNAIAVFVFSGVLARTIALVKVTLEDGSSVSLKAYFYDNYLLSWLPPINASLAFAIVNVVGWLAVLLIFYRYRIFIRI